MATLRRLLLALAVAFGLVLGLEFAARAAGFGALDPGYSTLKYQRIAFPLFAPLERGDVGVLATTDPRLPRQSFRVPKPAGTRRVFCFGGSALAGLGHSPNVTLAAQLQRALDAGGGEVDYEVFNLGVVAFASGQVRAMVADVLSYAEPDLLVVYSGNNEFLEVHSQLFAEAQGRGPGAVAGWVRSSALLRGLQGGGKIDRAALEASVSTRDLAANDARVDHSALMQEVELPDDEIARVLGRYQENLEAIARMAEEAGVPLALCTVESNWRWVGMEDPEPAEHAWLQAALDCSEGLVAGLRAQLERAPDHERYRVTAALAEAEERQAAHATAAGLFREARDGDPHLRRATTDHAERVRRAAESSENAVLIDTARGLQTVAPHGIVGFETFYDYVHFTPAGNADASRVLLDGLLGAGLVEVASPELARAALSELPAQGLTGADGLHVDRWIGFGDDPSLLTSRDLWKYDTCWNALDARLEADPEDWDALVWRGHLLSFKPGRAADARRDYAAALALRDDPLVRASLERLNAYPAP